MYKYIIYSLISAVTIIISKYLYQYFIKQNHSISTLKQEVVILNDKIKKLELELEKNKNSISGGINIPIQFAQIQKNSPLQFNQNTQNTINIENEMENSNDYSEQNESESDIASSIDSSHSAASVASNHSVASIASNHSAASNHSVASIASNHSVASNHSAASNRSIASVSSVASNHSVASNKISTPNNSISSENKSPIKEDSVSSKKSGKTMTLLETESVLDNELSQIVEPIIMDTNTLKSKRTIKKKAGLPDVKDFNNGDKITDDNGIEYLCVVGKRGGRSWKVLD